MTPLFHRHHAHTTGLETLGLKGGCIFFCNNLLKSMCFSKNGCFLISSAPFTPRRLDGSRLRRLVRMLRASDPMSGPKTRGSVRIFWYILSVTSGKIVNSKNSCRSILSSYHRRKVVSQTASRKGARRVSTSRWLCLRVKEMNSSVKTGRVFSYYILGRSKFLVQGTLAYHRRYSLCPSPSCSACRGRNHRVQYGLCNPGGCFLVSDH